MTIGAYKALSIKIPAAPEKSYLVADEDGSAPRLEVAIKPPGWRTRAAAVLIDMPLIGKMDSVLRARIRIGNYSELAVRQAKLALQCLNGFLQELSSVYGQETADLCKRDCLPKDGKPLTLRTVRLAYEKADQAQNARVASNAAVVSRVMSRWLSSAEAEEFRVNQWCPCMRDRAESAVSWQSRVTETAAAFMTEYVEKGCQSLPAYGARQIESSEIEEFAKQALDLYREVRDTFGMTKGKCDAILQEASTKSSATEMAAEVRVLLVISFVQQQFDPEIGKSAIEPTAIEQIPDGIISTVLNSAIESLRSCVAGTQDRSDGRNEFLYEADSLKISMVESIKQELTVYRTAMDGVSDKIANTARSMAASLGVLDFSSAIQSLSDSVADIKTLSVNMTKEKPIAIQGVIHSAQDPVMDLWSPSTSLAVSILNQVEAAAIFAKLSSPSGHQLLQGLLQSADKKRGDELSIAYLGLLDALADRSGLALAAKRGALGRLSEEALTPESLPVDLRRAVFSQHGVLNSVARKVFADFLVEATTDLDMKKKDHSSKMTGNFYSDLIRDLHIYLPDGTPMADLEDRSTVDDESMRGLIEAGYEKLISQCGGIENEEWMFKLSQSVGQTIFSTMLVVEERASADCPLKLLNGIHLQPVSPLGGQQLRVNIEGVSGDRIGLKCVYQADGFTRGLHRNPEIEPYYLDRTTSYLDYEFSANMDRSGVIRLEGDVRYDVMLEMTRWKPDYEEPSLGQLASRNFAGYDDLLDFAEKDGNSDSVKLLKKLVNLPISPSVISVRDIFREFLDGDDPKVKLDETVFEKIKGSINTTEVISSLASGRTLDLQKSYILDRSKQVADAEAITLVISDVVRIIGADLFPRFLEANMIQPTAPFDDMPASAAI